MSGVSARGGRGVPGVWARGGRGVPGVWTRRTGRCDLHTAAPAATVSHSIFKNS